MVFPTIEFAAFFLVVCTASWLLMPHPRVWKPFILVASYAFYGYADVRFCLLLAASTGINATAGWLLARRRDRRVLIVAVALNLGLLGWFKYFGFFVLSVDNMLEKVGLPAPLPLIQVALPIGISFFTFQAMSYVLDIWRGKIRPVPLLDFAVYEAFFPHLVAGPIVRASEFLPQLDSPRNPRAVPTTRAFFLIAGGLIKKVILADLIATTLVDPVFDTPRQHSGAEILGAIYGYAVQIYCDFSAYSEMAIGLALLLGFRFPDNFNRPYTAVNLQDFWRRWHMTLSRWLRDYLYVSLGGSRHGRRRTYRNLMLTMLLGGLWHGAAWTFVIWGGLHGTGLVVERWWADRRRREVVDLTGAEGGELIPAPRRGDAPARDPRSGESTSIGIPAPRPAYDEGRSTERSLRTGAVRTVPAGGARRVPAATVATAVAPVVLRRLVTFNFVCLAWVFFRSPDLATAFTLLSRLLTWAPGPAPLLTPPVLLAIVAGLGVQFVPAGFWPAVQTRFGRLSYLRQGLLLGALLVLLDAMVGNQGVAPFIYFRF